MLSVSKPLTDHCIRLPWFGQGGHFPGSETTFQKYKYTNLIPDASYAFVNGWGEMIQVKFCSSTHISLTEKAVLFYIKHITARATNNTKLLILIQECPLCRCVWERKNLKSKTEEKQMALVWGDSHYKQTLCIHADKCSQVQKHLDWIRARNWLSALKSN